MRFEALRVDGAFRIELDVSVDERGGFARIFCVEEFHAAGIDFAPVQCNISRNPRRGTLRGMHFQQPPHQEAKLVQCTKGAIFDVMVDLRRGSNSFGCAAWADLTDCNDTLLYIPAGCAHGFLTTASDTEVLYYMGNRFVVGSGSGIRWNDPTIGIPWPEQPVILSDRDAGYPALADLSSEAFA